MTNTNFITTNRQFQQDMAEIRFNDERWNAVTLAGVDIS